MPQQRLENSRAAGQDAEADGCCAHCKLCRTPDFKTRLDAAAPAPAGGAEVTAAAVGGGVSIEARRGPRSRRGSSGGVRACGQPQERACWRDGKAEERANADKPERGGCARVCQAGVATLPPDKAAPILTGRWLHRS